MISIVIPVYQSKENIARIMQDTFAQTYQDYEVLLVDDGSTDGSGEICKEYERQNPRVRAILKEHSGVSGTRNAGIANAKGDYIAFVDSDDRIEPDYLERLVQGIGDRDLIIASFDRRFYQGEKCVRTVAAYAVEAELDVAENLDSYFSSLYTSTLLGIVYCKLFKREILEKNRIAFREDIHIGEDYLFNFAYIKHCRRIRCISYVGYHYICREGNSLMHQADLRKFDYGKVLYEESLQFCEDMGLPEEASAGVSNLYLRTCFKNIENIYLLQERATRREKRTFIRRVMEDEDTRLALKASRPDCKEFKIYKAVLGTGNLTLIGAFSRLRLQYKRMLGRG